MRNNITTIRLLKITHNIKYTESTFIDNRKIAEDQYLVFIIILVLLCYIPFPY